jgi:hypothetical protein
VQESDYPTAGRFPAKVLERDLDRIVAMIQEIDEVLSRAVLVDAAKDEAPTANEILAALRDSIEQAAGFAQAAVDAAKQAQQAAQQAADAAAEAAKKELAGLLEEAQAAARAAEELWANAQAAADFAAREALAAAEAARQAIAAVASIPGFMDGAHSFVGLRAEGFELYQDCSESGDAVDADDYGYMTVLPAGATFRMDGAGNLRLEMLFTG